MPGEVARGRGSARREIMERSAEGMGMGVELIVVSAAYVGVMAAVFTKGVQAAAKTRRAARNE